MIQRNMSHYVSLVVNPQNEDEKWNICKFFQIIIHLYTSQHAKISRFVVARTRTGKQLLRSHNMEISSV